MQRYELLRGGCYKASDVKRELRKRDQRIAELEATRVSDELLEWLLSKAHYAGAWGDKYDKAEAILAKRKENNE